MPWLRDGHKGGPVVKHDGKILISKQLQECISIYLHTFMIRDKLLILMNILNTGHFKFLKSLAVCFYYLLYYMAATKCPTPLFRS